MSWGESTRVQGTGTSEEDVSARVGGVLCHRRPPPGQRLLDTAGVGVSPPGGCSCPDGSAPPGLMVINEASFFFLPLGVRT